MNKARDDDSTPLLLASKNGHCDIVDALLREAADVNKARNDGCTPLHLASFHGHKTCFEALACAGADFSLAFRGQTSLDLSSKKEHVESIGISICDGEVLGAKRHAQRPLIGSVFAMKHSRSYLRQACVVESVHVFTG